MRSRASCRSAISCAIDQAGSKVLEQASLRLHDQGEDDEIAGIVSERDLMRAIGQAGSKVLNKPVCDFMTSNIVTAREDDTSEQLMSEMTVHRIRYIPVVETGRLIGLISIGDLVKMQIADVEMEATATREYAGY